MTGFTARISSGEVAVLDGVAGGTERTLCLLWGRLTGAGGRAGDAARFAAEGHESWGEGVLERLEGQFALLLWDRERRRGLLARDPFGHRPVYLAGDGAALVAATEVRAVVALLPRRPVPDEVAVAHWLAGTGLPAGRTLHEGVVRLLPGHRLALGDRGARPAAWWRPRAGPPAIRVADDAAVVLGDAMAAATGRALQDARAPAVLLSGGLDSGAVAALAQPAAGRAYSCVFPDRPEVDESAAIRATRRHLGLTGVERRVAGGSALGAGLEYLLAHRMPSPSPNGFLWRPLLRRAARDGIATMLDGEGGDELLGCAPWLIADSVRAGRVREALALTRQIPGMGAHPRARWTRRALVHYGLRGALPGGAHRTLRALRRSPGPGDGLSLRLRRLHRETDERWTFKEQHGPRWRAALVHALTLGSDALGAPEHFAREAGLTGLSFRHPLRDPALLEAVLSLDPALSFDPVLDRPLARRALTGRLPDAVRLSVRKPEFGALLMAALAGPDAALVASVLDDPQAEVRRYLASPPRRPRRVWRAVMLECWLRLDDERWLTGLLERCAPGEERFWAGDP